MDKPESQQLVMPAVLWMRVTVRDGTTHALPATLTVDPSKSPPVGRIVGKVVEPFMLSDRAAIEITDERGDTIMRASATYPGDKYVVNGDSIQIGVAMHEA